MGANMQADLLHRCQAVQSLAQARVRQKQAAGAVKPCALEKAAASGGLFLRGRLNVVLDAATVFAGHHRFAGSDFVVYLRLQADIARGAKTVADLRHRCAGSICADAFVERQTSVPVSGGYLLALVLQALAFIQVLLALVLEAGPTSAATRAFSPSSRAAASAIRKRMKSRYA